MEKSLFETTFLSRRYCFAEGDEGNSGAGGSGNGSGSGSGDGGGNRSGDGGGEGGSGLAASLAGKGDGSGEGEGEGSGGTGEGSGGSQGDGGEGEGGGSNVDRPDNVPEQYWDAEKGEINTTALLKAHADTKADRDRLAAQVKDAGEGVPDEVEKYFDSDLVKDDHLRLPDADIPLVKAIYPDGVPTDDPMLSAMAESAMRNGIGQKAFLSLIGDFLVQQNGALPEALDVDAELQTLGEHGKEIVERYNNWTDGLVETGVFSPEDVANMRGFGATASEIGTMLKVMELAGGPTNNVDFGLGTGAGEGTPSYDEWYAQIPSSKENPTQADWEKWDAQGKALFGENPSGSSRSGLGMPASQGAVRRN